MEKGAKCVECAGADDECQITVVICATASGIFLPFQVIYQGNTLHVHQGFVFQMIGM